MVLELTEEEGIPKFAYLVQGASDNLAGFKFLKTNQSDLYLLSYDRPLDDFPVGANTIFLPNSTWAEGRNKLLELASRQSMDYLYYIFLDDDVEVVSGSFKDFEKMLLEYNPMMGVPLGDQIKETFRYVKEKLVHHPIAFDQIVQAYHKDVVYEGIALPYETSLDTESWWYACQINQYLTLRYYRGNCAQFNSVEIRNSAHKWESGKSDDSIYESGVTKEGLAKCALLIEKKYGLQPKLVNSLFHPRFTPKERYSPNLRWILKNRKKLSNVEKARKVAARVLAIVSGGYFKVMPSKNLISYHEFP